MKVVVTGASGYIGTELVQRLGELCYSVSALSRGSSPDQFVCLRSGEAGTLRQHMLGAEAVIHLAGQLVKDTSAPIASYLDANVIHTDEVMDAAASQGVQLVVHASSRLVYPATLAEAARESDAHPDTPYGLSKIWAENVVRYHCEQSNIAGLSLRIGQVTGGEHPGLGVINSFVRQAANNGVIRVTGSGQALRDIVHVRDVVDAFVKALDYRGPWRPLNIGGPTPTTILELAEVISWIAGPGAVEIEHDTSTKPDVSCYALCQEDARSYLGWSADVSLADILSEAWKDRGRRQ